MGQCYNKMEWDTHIGRPNYLGSCVVSSVVLVFSYVDEYVLIPDQSFPVSSEFDFQFWVFLNAPVVPLTAKLK